MIDKLKEEHFREIFGGNRWNQQGFVADMVPLMTKNKELFQKQLGHLVGGVHKRVVLEHFDAFYQMWLSFS